MGKRGGGGGKRAAATSTPFGSHNSISLREETSGKKQAKGGGTSNVKSILKHDHLQKLAVWATRDPSIPSLAAFFGHRLAAAGETLGILPDPSLFPCQSHVLIALNPIGEYGGPDYQFACYRCETILQPGFNCTIRIEKNKKKARHRYKKRNTSTQNNVVFTCHFCSHQNLKRGTPKGYMKEICHPKVKPSSKSEPAMPMLQNCSLEEDTGSKDDVIEVDETAAPTIAGDTPLTDGPETTLLDAKRRKRNRSGSKKPAEYQSASAAIDAEKSVGASSKRRRKSWTSLKEIAESSEQNSSRNITNITIPFFL